MKNRLKIARDFLREDGVIFVQCDDNEQAYLKVLMDEIFGRENFVSTSVWNSINSVLKQSKFIRKEHEYILIYAKDKNRLSFNKLENTMEFSNIDNDPNGEWFSSNAASPNQNSDKNKFAIKLPNGKECVRNWKFSYEDFIENKISLYFNNGNVPRLKIYKKDCNLYSKIQSSIFTELGSITTAKTELKALFLESSNSSLRGSEVTEAIQDSKEWIATNATHSRNDKEEANSTNALFATPKPEALLKRIIEISTQEGDLVMDFFAGSGTTLAVALKMKRRFVGIEQMDYIESITKERLKKVLDGEQGGISKAVGFKGGGEFAYLELYDLNLALKEKILKANELELSKIYQKLENEGFLLYSVDTKGLEKEEFQKLNLQGQRQILCECLDKNMDYVPYKDIKDSEYSVPSELIELNDAFYQGGENE